MGERLKTQKAEVLGSKQAENLLGKSKPVFNPNFEREKQLAREFAERREAVRLKGGLQNQMGARADAVDDALVKRAASSAGKLRALGAVRKLGKGVVGAVIEDLAITLLDKKFEGFDEAIDAKIEEENAKKEALNDQRIREELRRFRESKRLESEASSEAEAEAQQSKRLEEIKNQVVESGLSDDEFFANLANGSADAEAEGLKSDFQDTFSDGEDDRRRRKNKRSHPCDTSDQVASGGSLCGGRAATVQSGGREPVGLAFYSPKGKKAKNLLNQIQNGDVF